MKFRSLIQSTFYNVDEPVEVDLPLINLIVKKDSKVMNLYLTLYSNHNNTEC